jgi:hypothetical protein
LYIKEFCPSQPTEKEMLNLAILAIVMIVVAVVWLLIGGF